MDKDVFWMVFSISLSCRNGAWIPAIEIDENDVAAYLRGRHTRSVGAFECKNHRGVAYSVLLSNDFNVSRNVVEIHFGRFVPLCARSLLGQELHSPRQHCEYLICLAKN